MTGRWSLAGLCLLAAMTIAGAVIGWSDRRLAFERLGSIESTLSRRDTMITTKWHSSGSERSYTTTAAAGESPADHARRHVAELDAVQRVLPVDP